MGTDPGLPSARPAKAAAGASVTATLSIFPRLGFDVPVKEYICDCPHGMTLALAVDERADTAMVQTILARHDEAAGCDCTGELRKRYG